MSGRQGAALALALAALPAVLAGCAPRPPRNVLVILVDTLRASHLELYGYRRPTAPHLAAFARDNLLFEDVRSQAPCTYPSANSILTGRDGTAFWIQPGDRIGIPEGIPSLAEILGARGYGTAAVSASPIVRATPSANNRHGGFDRGFDTFDESCLWAEAPCVEGAGTRLLDTLPRPFFLYLHFMDPHDPYRPKVHHFSTATYPGKEFIESGDPNPICDQVEGRSAAKLEVTRGDLDHLEDLYDDEIASFDRTFGELVSELDRRGLLADTLIAVVADHGEEFLEHGDVKHCHTVYDTEIRTPMVLHLPGVRGGRSFAAQVENLDLLPTLLDYLGPGPPEGRAPRLDGLSLRPVIEEGEAVHPVVFAAWGSLRAAKEGRFKLVYDLATRHALLYDLATDPGETQDVAARHPREVDRLEHALSRRIREVEGSADESEALRRGQDAARRLTALGYVK